MLETLEKVKVIYEALKVNKYFKDIPNIGELAQKIIQCFNLEADTIVKEFYKMELWLDLNPKRRKKNYPRFIYNWLCRTNRPTVIQNKEVKNNGKDRGYKDIFERM